MYSLYYGILNSTPKQRSHWIRWITYYLILLVWEERLKRNSPN